MKQLIFSLAVAMLSVEAVAQTTTLSLKECIDYAMQNATSVKNATLDEEGARGKIGEIRSLGLPQIEATGQFVDNPRLQKSFLPASFLQVLGGGDSTGGNNGGNTNGVMEVNNDFAVVPNTFQLRNSADLKITASQLLFSSSYLVGLQAAKTYKELFERSSAQNKVQVVENVTKAYNLVLINKNRGDLLDINVRRLDTLLKQTRIQRENGFVEKIDVDRLDVTYQNLLIEKLKFENIKELGYMLLKYQIGMPSQQKVEVSGTIQDLNNEIAAPTETTSIYENRIDYTLLQIQRRLNILDVKYINSGYYPTLAAFGTVGFFRSGARFEQLVNGKYYDYNMWGLSLKVPIFDGLGKYYKAQQSKVTLRKTENTIDLMKNTIDMQANQSLLTLRNNIQTIQALKRTLDLSAEIARVSRIKYQEGVGSNIELIDAEASYRESMTNYYNGLYDALVSKIDYQKSLGTLSAQ